MPFCTNYSVPYHSVTFVCRACPDKYHHFVHHSLINFGFIYHRLSKYSVWWHLYNIYCLFTSGLFSGVFVSSITSQGRPRVSHVWRLRIILEYNGVEKSHLHNDYIVLMNYMRMRLFITLDNMKIYLVFHDHRRCPAMKPESFQTLLWHWAKCEYARVPVRKSSLDQIPHHFLC